MVRLLLPESMGKIGPNSVVDPYTFELLPEHPILRIGSSYSSIKQPIMEWLAQHYGHRVACGFDGTDYYIDFPTEADVTWFKLRWLS